ncbi:hypothetical protein M885DRAFT_611433 [Pelagophyceae sp. CCMP2097]|nr:hypothetical protein M885DRAFT_611433 [Pelagophyceae sp. CCMP2097]
MLAAQVVLAVWALGVSASRSVPAKCPAPSAKSQTLGEGKVDVSFDNTLGDELEVVWVDFQGGEVAQGAISPYGELQRSSFDGHVFRVYFPMADGGRVLIKEHLVQDPFSNGRRTRAQAVQLTACAEIAALVKTWEKTSKRAAEFEALFHDVSAPCAPAGKSSKWSCVKYGGAAELAKRDPKLYGIQPNETHAKRAYLTVDPTYVSQIGGIPRVTSGPGYAKMTFTEPLKAAIAWYHSEKAASTEVHGPIPGGYTNNDHVGMGKLNLDKFPAVHAAIVREMRDIMEWWTGMRLKHTSTFGVRIYHRNSALIDHVDRMDTHLASAVLQLDQRVDADGGWPLEVLLADRKFAEIYLQPGELILYEGAWLRHGRPMRFKGDEFANVFSHFAPPDWAGPTPDGHEDAYYGIPSNRLTTLADDGVITSDHYQKFPKQRPSEL